MLATRRCASEGDPIRTKKPASEPAAVAKSAPPPKPGAAFR
jgi:hypothetical protein